MYGTETKPEVGMEYGNRGQRGMKKDGSRKDRWLAREEHRGQMEIQNRQ
jgi:hypothetical protein